MITFKLYYITYILQSPFRLQWTKNTELAFPIYRKDYCIRCVHILSSLSILVRYSSSKWCGPVMSIRHCRRKVFWIVWTIMILALYIKESSWSTLIQNENSNYNQSNHFIICSTRKVSICSFTVDITGKAFSSAKSIQPRTDCEILDTDLSDGHATVIAHERMAATRRAFNQCVFRLGEHTCLVLLFDDDFFWE